MDPFERGSVTLAACLAVLRGLGPGDLCRASPCTEYTVGEVGEHVVRSMVLLGSVAGARVSSPGGGSLEAQVRTTAEGALEAWRGRGLGGSVAVGRSTYAADLAVEIIPLELLVHGWDMARATGSRIDVAPEVAGYLLEQARLLVTPDKRGRSFAAEVPVGPSATALERLIAFTGRVPSPRLAGGRARQLPSGPNRPTSPFHPIFAVDPAYAVDCGSDSSPNPP